MTPSILARVKYRARTSELVVTDWDADDVERAPKRAPIQRRVEITDSFLLAIPDHAANDAVWSAVKSAHRDLDESQQARIVASVLRRRTRLVARAALTYPTPRVRAVKAEYSRREATPLATEPTLDAESEPASRRGS